MKPRWFALPAVAAALVLVTVATAANGNANYRAVCPAAPVGAAHCHAMVVTDANGNPTASSTPPAGSYGPAQFHTGYSLPTTAGSAQTIGIVDAYDEHRKRPRCLREPVRPAVVHDRERVLPEGQPDRRNQLSPQQHTYYNHPGVAITASSGDGGYGVEFLAASQYVTAVGGTTVGSEIVIRPQQRRMRAISGSGLWRGMRLAVFPSGCWRGRADSRGPFAGRTPALPSRAATGGAPRPPQCRQERRRVLIRADWADLGRR